VQKATFGEAVTYNLRIMKSKIGVLCLVFFVVLLGLLSSWPTYRVSDRTGVGLMWNHQEAYLSGGVHRRGYRMTYLEYLLGYVEAYFYAGPSANDDALYTVLVHVTPSTVQTFVVENKGFDFYASLDGAIYASGADGLFWKWSGDHFEKATKNEQETLQSTSKQDFKDVHGWSRRTSLTETPWQDVKIEIDGQSVTFMVTSGEQEVSVEISKSNGKRERVFYLDQRFRELSKLEYETVFAQKGPPEVQR
jgi:hypothetical protein